MVGLRGRSPLVEVRRGHADELETSHVRDGPVQTYHFWFKKNDSDDPGARGFIEIKIGPIRQELKRYAQIVLFPPVFPGQTASSDQQILLSSLIDETVRLELGTQFLSRAGCLRHEMFREVHALRPQELLKRETHAFLRVPGRHDSDAILTRGIPRQVTYGTTRRTYRRDARRTHPSPVILFDTRDEIRPLDAFQRPERPEMI